MKEDVCLRAEGGGWVWSQKWWDEGRLLYQYDPTHGTPLFPFQEIQTVTMPHDDLKFFCPEQIL